MLELEPSGGAGEQELLLMEPLEPLEPLELLDPLEPLDPLDPLEPPSSCN